MQFLRSGDYDQAELDEALHTIESSARLQARLIDDMLDVSRIILGKFQVDLKPTRVSDIVEAAAHHRPAHGRRATACSLTWEIDARETPGRRRRQPDPAGHPATCSPTPSSSRRPARTSTCASTRRDGSLQHPRHATKARGSSRRSFRTSSTACARPKARTSAAASGLGLAIARHIVELHHGEITAASEGPGRGASFTVILPVRADDAHADSRVEQNHNVASMHV